MHDPASAPHGDAQRLERLERSVRRLLSVSVMLALAFVVLLIWQFYPRSHALAAPGFVVVDAHQKARAELALLDDGTPMLRLNDTAERARLSMFLRADGAGVMRIADGNGVNRAELLVDRDGSPQFSLGSAEGRAIVTIAAGEGGAPRIRLADPQQKAIWSAP